MFFLLKSNNRETLVFVEKKKRGKKVGNSRVCVKRKETKKGKPEKYVINIEKHAVTN